MRLALRSLRLRRHWVLREGWYRGSSSRRDNLWRLRWLSLRLRDLDLRLRGLSLRLRGLGLRLRGLSLRLRWLGLRLRGLNLWLRGLSRRLRGLGLRLRGRRHIGIHRRKCLSLRYRCGWLSHLRRRHCRLSWLRGLGYGRSCCGLRNRRRGYICISWNLGWLSYTRCLFTSRRDGICVARLCDWSLR